MNHHEAVKAFFDEHARATNEAAREAQVGDLADQVLGAMEVRPGQQLIDLGCGLGWTTKKLGKMAPGAQAVGVDLSPGMIERADAETDWTARARFEAMPVESLDFPDGRFDHAFAFEAVEYLHDPRAALREVARVMKDGALLEIVIRRFDGSPATEGWGSAIGVELPWLDADAWREVVAEAGFEPLSPTALNDRRDFVPFEASPFTPDEASHASIVSAGALWIRATRAGASA